MACKYKNFHELCTKPYCEVTDGECQFIIDSEDSVCSIREAYHGEELLETPSETDKKKTKKS